MKIEDKKITNLIEKLAKKKAGIEFREKILKDKERKIKTRRFIQVGSIAAKFEIDGLDDETLVGAFAEMQERSKQGNTLAEWKQKGLDLSETRLSPLIVSFAKEVSDEVKASLKEKRFKWNTFRKEWQGYGIREEIETLVKEFGGIVDVAKN